MDLWKSKYDNDEDDNGGGDDDDDIHFQQKIQ
jgi:hypothetical protein